MANPKKVYWLKMKKRREQGLSQLQETEADLAQEGKDDTDEVSSVGQEYLRQDQACRDYILRHNESDLKQENVNPLVDKVMKKTYGNKWRER